jgi:hypothetical protein
MKTLRNLVAGLFALTLSIGVAAAADDDDDKPAPGDPGTLPTLTADQQRAAGIVVAHPVDAEVAQHDDAIVLVLDPAVVIADAGEADAAFAAARAASAEVERARGLYGAGAGASLKAVQAAEAEQAKARAQADATAAKFASHWKAIAAMPVPTRQKLFADFSAGSALLARADLPGRHLLGSLPDRALLDVDGIGVPAKVIGLASQGAEEAQGVGVLIEIRNAPNGLAPGARVPAALLGAKRSGVVIPREAVLYEEDGALVYKQLTAKPGDKQARYTPVHVKLLQAHGEGWLVDGIDDDDNIVVHGAGVLWSLQGLVGHAAGDIDDDND